MGAPIISACARSKHMRRLHGLSTMHFIWLIQVRWWSKCKSVDPEIFLSLVRTATLKSHVLRGYKLMCPLALLTDCAKMMTADF